MVIDITKLEADAKAEIAVEFAASAKSKIKSKLREIAQAERIVANLKDEYAILLKDVGASA